MVLVVLVVIQPGCSISSLKWDCPARATTLTILTTDILGYVIQKIESTYQIIQPLL
jgi:hypothetical protein